MNRTQLFRYGYPALFIFMGIGMLIRNDIPNLRFIGYFIEPLKFALPTLLILIGGIFLWKDTMRYRLRVVLLLPFLWLMGWQIVSITIMPLQPLWIVPVYAGAGVGVLVFYHLHDVKHDQ